jgi:hypothetical protein
MERGSSEGGEAGQSRTVIIPEATERPTKPIERCRSILAPLSSPVGRRIAGDYETVDARPNELIVFQVISGPARPTGTYRFEPVGGAARVIFTQHYPDKFVMSVGSELSLFMKGIIEGGSLWSRMRHVLRDGIVKSGEHNKPSSLLSSARCASRGRMGLKRIMRLRFESYPLHKELAYNDWMKTCEYYGIALESKEGQDLLWILNTDATQIKQKELIFHWLLPAEKKSLKSALEQVEGDLLASVLAHSRGAASGVQRLFSRGSRECNPSFLDTQLRR